jgi:hypothetical protein
MTTVSPDLTLDARTAVSDLRRARRRRRLGDREWGELAYKAYTTALAALVAVVFLSGLVGDTPFDAAGIAEFGRRAPVWYGLIAAVALVVGVRSGTRGGPVALEAPDVQHLLLGPVDRTWVLHRPAIGLLGYGTATGAIVGGLVGGLVDQRVGETTLPWVGAGAVFGATTVALAVGAAMVTSARRLPRWLVLVVAWALVAWSAADAAERAPMAPLTALGEVAVWPITFDPWSLVPIVVTAALAAVGLRVLGGVSVELAQRRTALVGQLRFAATQRDLRTVVLLRRQLAAERPRSRHWFPTPPAVVARRFPILSRDLQSVARWPLVRILRVLVLLVGAALAARGLFSGTTPLLLAAGLATYVAALDAIEPLAQDIDHPTLLQSYPEAEGMVMVRHLAQPVVVMVAFGIAATGVAWAVSPDPDVIRIGAVCILPAAVAAVCGAAITVVSEVDVDQGENTIAMATPEVAGPRLLFRTVWPPIVAVLGFVPVLVARTSELNGDDPVSGAAAGSVPILLLCGLVVLWVRFRADIHRSMAQAGGAPA